MAFFSRNEESPFRALTHLLVGVSKHQTVNSRNEESPFRALTLVDFDTFNQFFNVVEMKKARLGR